jgi:hypothetical protein
MHGDANKLIPELSAWNGGAGIDVQSWIGCVGRYDYALGYASLFWPDFVMHDGCILLHTPEPQNYLQWMNTCQGNRTKVEAVLNHRHILDLFPNSEFQPSKEVVLHIGRLLKDMWSAKLHRAFPDSPVRVEFHEDCSDNLLECEITVFQDRSLQLP